MTTSEKVCGKCRMKLHHICFTRNRSQADGRSFYCKRCFKRYREEWEAGRLRRAAERIQALTVPRQAPATAVNGGEAVSGTAEVKLDPHEAKAPPVPLGRVFAGVMLEKLYVKAQAGDPVAEAAFALCLKNVAETPSLLRRARDDEIRRLAAELRATHEALTTNAAATLLATAGDIIESGQRDLSGLFGILESEEGKRLSAAICDVIAYAPANQLGKRWPDWRQITRMIAR
jgi:hypothetical protein